MTYPGLVVSALLVATTASANTRAKAAMTPARMPARVVAAARPLPQTKDLARSPGETGTTLPAERVAAYWRALMSGDYGRAYDLYAAKAKLSLAPEVSEGEREERFRQVQERQARRARLIEVGIGRMEVSAGRPAESANKAVVLCYFRAQMVGEQWQRAATNVLQSSVYWVFTRTTRGWEAEKIISVGRVGQELPAPRVPVGPPATILEAGPAGPVAYQVAAIHPVEDTGATVRAMAEELHEQADQRALRHLRLVSWGRFSAVMVAGMATIAGWLASCRRRAARRQQCG